MTGERVATCQCGALRLTASCAPLRVTVCHCRACQRRSGSAFAVAARFAATSVTTEGATASWTRVGDEGSRLTFHFCPACGSTVWYENDRAPGFVAVPVGGFADPGFPAPGAEIYKDQRHPWVSVRTGPLAKP